MEPLAELRKHVQGKFIIGAQEAQKLINQRKLGRVYIASNCPAPIKAKLEESCPANECELVELAIPNDEVGTICKKPFSISVVGVPK